MENLNSDKAKSIERKVQELIFRKLYIKVDDEKIFIEKKAFVTLVLKDIISLAISDYDIESALIFSLKIQPEYNAMPEVKRNELEETSIEFANEVEAYKGYLTDKKECIPDNEIYFNVLFALNSEHKVLEDRLHEFMMESLSRKMTEEASQLNVTYYQLLDTYAEKAELIAQYDSIDEALDESFSKFEDPRKHLLDKNAIKQGLIRISKLANEEISAYKIALDLESHDVEFAMILSVVRQMLYLEELE